jgi:hypothetical protein
VAVCAVLPAPPAVAVPSADRIAIGDSVMLGARSALKAKGFRVDAATSRQSYSGPALLRERSDSLPTNVVVHLGTNGTFPLSTCKAIVRAAGPDRRVFLVTVHAKRSWVKGNNRAIKQCADGFAKGRVYVIDWNALAQEHRSWLYSDGIHLKPAGAAAFAGLIDTSVSDAVAAAKALERLEALANAHGSGTAAVEG